MTDATGDHLETEHKYDADAGFVLPSFDDLPGVDVTGPELNHLHATYYDTEDLALSASRVTLRRRVGGADQGWHLKLPVRADTRQELHAPLGDGDTVPPRLSDQVADIIAGRPLHPIATLDTERTTLTLTGSAGQVLAEVADDSVAATRLDAAGGPAAAPLRWREIEVEAGPDGRDGTAEIPAVLEAADRLLLGAGARRSSSASKLGRLLGR
ncbi:MAG: CYTH domain-containing protein [Streptosporangiaceae bacterium]